MATMRVVVDPAMAMVLGCPAAGNINGRGDDWLAARNGCGLGGRAGMRPSQGQADHERCEGKDSEHRVRRDRFTAPG